jgi:hypothetical protein
MLSSLIRDEASRQVAGILLRRHPRLKSWAGMNRPVGARHFLMAALWREVGSRRSNDDSAPGCVDRG